MDKSKDPAKPVDPYIKQKQAYRSLKESSYNNDRLSPIRIAILPSSTIDHFLPVFQYWLFRTGFNAEFYTSTIDTTEPEILSFESDLYAFEPDITIIFPSQKNVLDRAPIDSSSDIISVERDRWNSLWEKLTQKSKTQILHCTCPLPASSALGNSDSTHPEGVAYRIMCANFALTKNLPRNVYLFDLANLANEYGLTKWHDPRLWFHSKHSFSFDAYGLVAHRIARTIAGIRGMAKKVCIIDLDHTLWGGVVGDDGIEKIQIGPDSGPDGEAFSDFQNYLKSLKNQGVLLAICSKNELKTAKLPFLKHPDMVLKLEDFAAFEANWEEKPKNILKIAKQLNLGLDSMVFIDDNPVERDFVQKTLPEVTVVELPSDPSLYVSSVAQLHLFEKPSITDEDTKRTAMMIEDQRRKTFIKSTPEKSINLRSYLENLDLKCTIEKIQTTNLERSAQLINKTNQFNLTAARISEKDLLEYTQTNLAQCYRLNDRFGQYGIVSVVLAKINQSKLVIDVWVMSCRVFERTLEDFVLMHLIQLARNKKCLVIEIHYIPTNRNQVSIEKLKKLGFKSSDETIYQYHIQEQMHITHVQKEQTPYDTTVKI